jgi:hypothetical protein
MPRKCIRKTKPVTRTDISYGKTAYIPNVGDKMLDDLQRCGLSICMTGEDLFLTDYEHIEEYIQDHALTPHEKTDKTLPFLIMIKGLIDHTKDPDEIIGDVVFVA